MVDAKSLLGIVVFKLDEQQLLMVSDDADSGKLFREPEAYLHIYYNFENGPVWNTWISPFLLFFT